MKERPVVMVSGATGGIGRETALQLRQSGWQLSLGSRNVARAQELIPDDGTTLHVPYDAEDPAAAEAWVARTIAAFGRLDAIVNSAGVLLPFEMEDGAAAEGGLDRMWEINVKAPLRLIRAALPALKGSGGGQVVNVASLSGVRPGNTGLGYAMTKAALIALTHQIRTRYWAEGVRCTALCPGAVDTGMIADIRGNLIHAPSAPGDIARSIVFLLSLPPTASVALLAVNSRPDALW